MLKVWQDKKEIKRNKHEQGSIQKNNKTKAGRIRNIQKNNKTKAGRIRNFIKTRMTSGVPER